MATEEPLAMEVVEVYPHDAEAFTQGLELASDGWLYETTGGHGRSSLRRVDLRTGAIDARLDLDDAYFGEGLVEVAEHLIWLTWEHQVAFVVDRENLEIVDQLHYDGEGWGICRAGDKLCMSNSTGTLLFRDPETFEVTGELPVSRTGSAYGPPNDLSAVGDVVWANTWAPTLDEILGVDLHTGQVVAAVDGRGLLPAAVHRQLSDMLNAILNGITHDPADDTFLVTGKLWPLLFRVRFVPAPERLMPRGATLSG